MNSLNKNNFNKTKQITNFDSEFLDLQSNTVFIDSSKTYLFPPLHQLEHQTKKFQTKDSRHWKTFLQKSYAETCALTGLKSSDQIQLVGHHLYSKTKHPSLAKNFLNGILLENNFHKLYHRDFGKDPCSVDPYSFISFIHSLSYSKSFRIKATCATVSVITNNNVLVDQEIKGEPFLNKKTNQYENYISIPLCKKRLFLLEQHILLLQEYLS